MTFIRPYTNIAYVKADKESDDWMMTTSLTSFHKLWLEIVRCVMDSPPAPHAEGTPISPHAEGRPGRQCHAPKPGHTRTHSLQVWLCLLRWLRQTSAPRATADIPEAMIWSANLLRQLDEAEQGDIACTAGGLPEAVPGGQAICLDEPLLAGSLSPLEGFTQTLHEGLRTQWGELHLCWVVQIQQIHLSTL